MDNNIIELQELLNKKRILENQLDNLLWGAVEVRNVRNGRYIYLHKRERGVNKTLYVAEFSDELHNQILNNNIVVRKIKKEIREISARFKKMGYVEIVLSEKVKTNIDYAKRNMVDTIYRQARLEGVAVTFLDTERIIEGGLINNISVDDVHKINNLKHAWQLILDEGVICSPSDYSLLCLLNKLVEEGFYYSAGMLRTVPVSIGGIKWQPDFPIESMVKEQLCDILAINDVYDRAITALLFVCRKQLFIDGNKRTAVLFANHILISAGAGLVSVPEEYIPEYKVLLLNYYETNNIEIIKDFMFNNCLTRL